MTERQTAKTDAKYEIGFGKGVRVGNFRLYKLRASVGAKQHLDSIVITDLSQGWKVQIPSTMNNYLLIQDAYKLYVDGNEEPLRIMIDNLWFTTTMPDARLHRLLMDLSVIWSNPDFVVEKDGAKTPLPDAIANDVRWVWEDVLNQYEADKEAEEQSPDEKQLARDETFHKMLDELNELKNQERNEKDAPKSE